MKIPIRPCRVVAVCRGCDMLEEGPLPNFNRILGDTPAIRCSAVDGPSWFSGGFFSGMVVPSNCDRMDVHATAAVLREL